MFLLKRPLKLKTLSPRGSQQGLIMQSLLQFKNETPRSGMDLNFPFKIRWLYRILKNQHRQFKQNQKLQFQSKLKAPRELSSQDKREIEVCSLIQECEVTRALTKHQRWLTYSESKSIRSSFKSLRKSKNILDKVQVRHSITSKTEQHENIAKFL